MVREIACECSERFEAGIDTYALFQEIKTYFESQEKRGVYCDIPVDYPFFIGHSNAVTLKWYASKWYKCKVCGCLWELDYPDFPAHGFVRKFPDGVYIERGY